MFILQDAWTPHACTLLKYFAAEGVACQQKVFWAGPPEPSAGNQAGASPLVSRLPKQVAAHSSRQVKLPSTQQEAPLDVLLLVLGHVRDVEPVGELPMQSGALCVYSTCAARVACKRRR